MRQEEVDRIVKAARAVLNERQEQTRTAAENELAAAIADADKAIGQRRTLEAQGAAS